MLVRIGRQGVNQSVRLVSPNPGHQIVTRPSVALRSTTAVVAHRDVVVVSGVVGGIVDLVQVVCSLAERAFALTRANRVHNGYERCRKARSFFIGLSSSCSRLLAGRLTSCCHRESRFPHELLAASLKNRGWGNAVPARPKKNIALSSARSGRGEGTRIHHIRRRRCRIVVELETA